MPTMGLMGVNNPIYQASQNQVEQSGQARNMAVQGIINQAMQQKQNEMTAQLKTYATLMESKDPYLFQKGYEGMTGLTNVPANNDVMTHMDDIRNSWVELRKLEGKVDPQTFNGLVKETLTRYGSVPEGMADRAQKASEANFMSQASQVPDLQKAGLMSPQEASQGISTALEQAGPKGQEAMAAMLKQENKPTPEFNIPADLDTFLSSISGRLGVDYSTTDGRMAALRKFGADSKLADEFAKWKQKLAPQSYTFLPTSEGFVPANTRQGTVSAPTGLAKPLSNEMITTQQQIGTVKDVFDRVKEGYKPSYVGPVAGRLGSLKSATVGNPEEQAAFYSNLADLNNTLVYLKSGKQINEQEYARLKKAMPHQDLPVSEFRARMNEFDKTLNSIVTEREKNMGGYGVSKISKTESTGLPDAALNTLKQSQGKPVVFGNGQTWMWNGKKAMRIK